MNPDESVVAERAEAVAAWYDEHVDSVFGYVARRIGPEPAADVVADVFRIAIERFASFDPARASERAWLFGIATNLIRRHWRWEERSLRAIARAVSRERVAVGETTGGVDDRLDAARRLDRLIEAVIHLPPDDRDLLVLVAWEGCSHAEVAGALNIPVGTVRSRLHRIRRQLAAATGETTHD